MSALLINIDISLLALFWTVAISLIGISVCLCLTLTARRYLRNSFKNNTLREQSKLETLLNLALTQGGFVLNDASFEASDSSVFNEVLLRYYRTLDGKRADTLRHITQTIDIEPQIRESTQTGTIGRRMEAMQVLSYLNSQSSLLSIHEGLSSPKKYIRLTAARCLTRRRADIFIDDIIHSISTAFPDDPELLADILFRFGPHITSTLQTYIETHDNSCVKAACLEALVLIMPAQTSLDFDALLEDPDERVRAAATSLSAVTAHNTKEEILIKALSDSSTKVKIRAAKLAHSARRTDTISPLFNMTQDPLLWVRYWSIKAIWNTGRQGKKLVETMSRGDDAASRMAREVSLECRSHDLGVMP